MVLSKEVQGVKFYGVLISDSILLLVVWLKPAASRLYVLWLGLRSL